MSSAATRRALLVSAGMLVAVQPGTAQTTIPPSSGDVPAATEAQGAEHAGTLATAAEAAPPEAQSGEIVVTGSRIARPDFAAPNPIVSLNAANIQQSGDTNITNFLLRVPALTNSLDSTQTANSFRLTNTPYGAAGLNELDLRGLGTQRTLVLVDGRRHVAGQFGSAAVDIGAIPTDLIERVDVLTAGASAVYGADGVSGVVNFILKRDFDGIAARSQMGVSEHGDGANHFASVIAGKNFAGGRGNVTLAYEYSFDGALANDDRDYLRQNERKYVINNDGYLGPGTGTYQRVLQGDLRYPGESPYGVIDINGDGIPDFRGDGAIYNPGTNVSYYQTGGDATPVAGFVGYLLPRIERHAVNLLTHYDFSDAAKLSLEGKFVQVTATTFDSPSGDYPAALSIDNPFMPESIRQAAIAAGQDTIYETRDNFDFPNKGETDRRRTYRGVVDLTGRISDHASYDIYYTYGRTEERIDKLNDRWNDRMLAALDVVQGPNGPICRSNLDPAALQTPAISFTPGPNSGCLPLNIFGKDTASTAAVDWVLNGDNRSTAAITQQVVSGSVTGDFGQFFELPGGPLAFAFGGEWRRETSRFDPNQFLQGKEWYQYDEGNSFDPAFIIAPSSGSFDVAEAFGELNAPILKDRPFAQTLAVGAAGRYSHYSTVGSTSAYQFNGVWAPVRDVSFRGSYGRSVRAPNIGELFTPTTGASAFFDDPCYLENRGRGTQYRNANCLAIIAANGNTPPDQFTGSNNPDAVSFISGSQSGNPDLQEEKARTWTAGLVLRPSFLPGLSLSADWYDIRLRGAINLPDAQTIANLCVDQPTTDNVFCREISRKPGTGYINGFAISPQNVSNFRTAGLDLNINYLIHTAHAGTFDLRFVGGYLHRLDIIQTPGATTENDVDQIGRPKFSFVFSPTWTAGPVTVSYNLRWHDGERRFARTDTDNNPDLVAPDLLRYKSLWEHDIQVDVAVTRAFDLYVGVNNLTDQHPDEDTTNQPISPLGRFIYAGAKMRFRGL